MRTLALAEVAASFAAAPGGVAVTQSYAPSGLLRQRIAAGAQRPLHAGIALV